MVAKTIYDTIYKENLIPDAMTRDRAVKPKYTNQQLQMEINQYSVANHVEPSKKDLSPQNITRDAKDDQKDEVDLKVSNIDSIFITNRSQLNDDNVIEFAKKYSEPASPFDEDENILVERKHAEVRFPKLLYIGQLHGTYLICESDDGMYIVDQHAAQERINYERLREEIGEVSDDQQNLLVPLVLNYPNRDALIISEKLETLKKVGLDIESFGNNSFIIKQHPTWISEGTEEETIREMIDWVLSHKDISVADFRADTAIMMSCKQAIKANHHLDRKQAVHLLDELATVNNPFNCPHGRPVLVSFSNTDMEKMFKRIQDPHGQDKFM